MKSMPPQAVLNGLEPAVIAAKIAMLKVAYDSSLSTNTPLGRVMMFAQVDTKIAPCSSDMNSTFTEFLLAIVDPVMCRMKALRPV